MKNLIFATFFFLCVFLSCTHSPAEQSAASAVQNQSETPGKRIVSNQEKPQITKPLSCVRMINQFGKVANCQCPSGLVYNPITGKCEQGGRICTQALVEMYNEKTGQCYTARNGCEASDLKSIGWRKRLNNDKCNSKVERQ